MLNGASVNATQVGEPSDSADSSRFIYMRFDSFIQTVTRLRSIVDQSGPVFGHLRRRLFCWQKLVAAALMFIVGRETASPKSANVASLR